MNRSTPAIAAAAVLAAIAFWLVGFELGWWSGAGDGRPVLGPPPSVTREPRDTRPLVPRASSVHPVRDEEPPRAQRQDPQQDETPASEASIALETTRAEREEVVAPRTGDLVTSGLPEQLGALETARAVETIARLRIAKPGAASGRAAAAGGDHVMAEVVALYRGDPILLGRRIELRPGHEASRRTFLSWDFDAEKSVRRGEVTCIAALRDDGVSKEADSKRALAVAFGRGYAVTLVSESLPPITPSLDEYVVVDELGADLVQSLADPRAPVRVSSITALLHFEDDGGKPPPRVPTRLWRDPETAAALLRATRDRSSRVRWSAAWLDPSRAVESGLGPEAGRSALLGLLFDPVPLVRRAAEQRLGEHGDGELLCPLLELRDEKIAERWSREVAPSTIELTSDDDAHGAIDVVRKHADAALRLRYLEAMAERRARGGAGLLASRLASEAVTQALKDRDVDVRAAAAEALAVFGEADSTCALLESLPSHEDARVLALAAATQIRLGDRNGFARLRRIALGNDPRAAAIALELAGRLARAKRPDPPHDDLVALQFEVLDHRHLGVRSRAMAQLAWQSAALTPEQRERLGESIAARLADPAPCVRAAAQAATLFLARVHDESDPAGELFVEFDR